MKRGVAAVLLIISLVLQGTISVLAGTTGSISGTVVDASTNQPISGAKVTAVSPSQQATTTSDRAGHYAFLSLAPDTYSVSVPAAGNHDAYAVNGITVQADQNVIIPLAQPAKLQQIGRVTSRSASALVKPGTSADMYSVTPVQAEAAAPLGGGGSLNQAYSAIASVPGVFIPMGQVSWGQSVYVRGGNYTQLGYEFDGVPVQRAYDAYPSSTLSALGQQEVQVYTGSQPGVAQSSGLAGFINQVIRTGTYPATGSLSAGLGAPADYHKLQFEYGGANASRNFSYYLGAGTYNQQLKTLDPYNGSRFDQSYSTYPFAAIQANCGTAQATAGCYTNGFGAAPNGYVWAPLTYGQNQFWTDHEAVANLHFGIPHSKDGLKDDIQLLGQVSFMHLGYNDSLSSFGPMAQQFFQTGTLNFNGTTYQDCSIAAAGTPCAVNLYGLPGQFQYPIRNIYTGPTGGALTAANLSQVAQYNYPAAPTGIPFGGVVDPYANGTEQVNDGTFKLQYTHQMGQNAYARIYGYSLYSDWLNNDPNGFSNANLAFVPSDYILPTHTRGLGLTLADQLGNHLLNLTGGYSTATLSRWNNSFTSTGNPVAVLVDSTNPTNGLCYTSALAAVYCGSSHAARYVVPGTNKLASRGLQPGTYVDANGNVVNANGTIDVTNASTLTCGGGPCEFLAVGSGLNGSFNDVSPKFSNLALSDSWHVNSKLSLDLAVRYDSFQYDIPSALVPGGPNPAGTASNIGRTQFNNSYNAFHCYSPATGVTSTSTANGCPAGTQVAFGLNGADTQWYGGFQPRVGATFSLDSLNVLRAGYGRYLQPTSTAYLFYNRAGADVASYDVPKFYGYGFTTPEHAIPPQESWNLDFSWEHQARNSDFSFKLSPFWRRTRNENINVVLDPTTNFVSGIDALSSDVKGFELALRKGDFNRNGFSGQLAYTYTFVKSRYQTLPGGSTALDNVNQSVKQYNAYTSFCAANPNDARCGSTSTGVAAAPCYDNAGNPDPACAATSIANPYWNAPAQPLFDPNAYYAPYNQTFGTGFSSNASSYNIPHVASLIVNYKHDKWNVTPSMQFVGGGKYGSPVMGIGVDPAIGCGALAGTTANDPRYPYGATGGAPYDAASCSGYIVAPNTFTGRFDAPGAFTEPNQLVFNLGVGYQASPRVKINLLAANVFGTCFGGSKEPWTTAGPKIGCWYGAASGFQAGNFYNPGNAFTAQAMPYAPVVGEIAGQQAYGTAIQPLQLFLTAQIKL
jgi:hypothetical protein